MCSVMEEIRQEGRQEGRREGIIAAVETAIVFGASREQAIANAARKFHVEENYVERLCSAPIKNFS